jgi:hypothetical protein
VTNSSHNSPSSKEITEVINDMLGQNAGAEYTLIFIIPMSGRLVVSVSIMSYLATRSQPVLRVDNFKAYLS